LVIARGGFSGLFADSSQVAYSFAQQVSLPNVILWCDVQLTKDGTGICVPDVKLENSTSISDFFKNRKKAYLVNGAPTEGYFSVDFTLKELSNVYCKSELC
jgi:glycerophosphoryl diester phosphodiesterase